MARDSRDWSDSPDDYPASPSGSSELLDKAVGVLGAEDPDQVKDKVHEIAVDFLKYSKVWKSAPTLADVERRLKDIAKKAAALRSALEEADSYTLRALKRASADESAPKHGALLSAELRPFLSDEEEDFEEEVYFDHKLHGLEQLVDFCLETPFWTIPGYKESMSKGGRQTLLSKTQSPPKWQLAARCFEIMLEIGKDAPTGSRGGPYHQFVNAVYEYATGKNPDERDGLEAQVTRIPALFTRHMKLLDMQKAAGELERNVNRLGGQIHKDASKEGQLQDIAQELRDVQFEMSTGKKPVITD